MLYGRLLPPMPASKARTLVPLIRCGEYSLASYCASVLLSFAAQALLSTGWNGLPSQTLVALLGLGLMSALAVALAAIDRGAFHNLEPF